MWCSFQRAIIEVKAIDIDVRFHIRVLKKQRPPFTAASHPAPEGARGVSEVSIRGDTILSRNQMTSLGARWISIALGVNFFEVLLHGVLVARELSGGSEHGLRAAAS